MHEEREREAEVGVGGGRRRRGVRSPSAAGACGGAPGGGRDPPGRPVARLHEPLAQTDEVAGQEAALDEVVEGLEEERAALVGQSRLPGALLAICKRRSMKIGSVPEYEAAKI